MVQLGKPSIFRVHPHIRIGPSCMGSIPKGFPLVSPGPEKTRRGSDQVDPVLLPTSNTVMDRKVPGIRVETVEPAVCGVEIKQMSFFSKTMPFRKCFFQKERIQITKQMEIMWESDVVVLCR